MFNEAISIRDFVKFCFRRSTTATISPSVSRGTLDNHHGLILELSGDVRAAKSFYSTARSDLAEAEFHYHRLSLEQRDEVPIGVKLSLMKAAAYNGGDVGKLFFGIDAIFHDPTTAEYWLRGAAQNIEQAKLPWAASLICLGRLKEVREVLVEHAKAQPESTSRFVRGMRARIAPSLVKETVLHAFDSWTTSNNVLEDDYQPTVAAPKTAVNRLKAVVA